MFWDFGSLQKHRASAGHMVVCVVIDQSVYPPTIRCSPGLVQNILTHLGVDGVRDVSLSSSRRVPFLGFVTSVRSTRDVAAS